MAQNYLTLLFFTFSFVSSFAQVGINTSNPRESLHIAGSTGTIRVESLDYINNPRNGGDVDGDGDLTNNSFPLYVDSNGDFTLELQAVAASDDGDAFVETSLPTSSVFLPSTDTDGEIATLIDSFTLTVNRPAILEVKYGISFDIYANALKGTITDKKARRIENYVVVTGDTRHYGPATMSYSSRSSSSQVGAMYNSASTYIKLPAAGTYSIDFMGLVSTNLSSDASTPISIDTYVEFATGKDFLFMRLH